MDESVFEQAEKLTTALTDEALERIRKAIPKQPEGFDGLCEDCSGPIPPQRIKFGAITCVDCQQIREQRAKRTIQR